MHANISGFVKLFLLNSLAVNYLLNSYVRDRHGKSKCPAQKNKGSFEGSLNFVTPDIMSNSPFLRRRKRRAIC